MNTKGNIISESQLQIGCIRWFDIQYPQYSNFLFHIRNGGSIKSAREGLKFKRMGVRKGIPDLFLSLPNSDFHGMYIEMKRRGGRPTMEQMENQIRFKCYGYEFIIVDNIEEFINVVKDYLKSVEIVL